MFLILFIDSIKWFCSIVILYYLWKLVLKNRVSCDFIYGIKSQLLDNKYIQISLGISVLVSVILFVLKFNIVLITILFMVINIFVPYIIASYSYEKGNLKDIDGILDFLSSMMVSLKTGMNLIDSISNACENISNTKIKSDIESILIKYNLGVSIEEAIMDLSKNGKIDSNLYDLVFNPILICMSYGGNLINILNQISTILIRKKKVILQLKSLTSQIRIQSAILLFISPLIVIGMGLFDHDRFYVLMNTMGGNAILVFAMVLEIIGFFIIRKMMNIST